MTTSIMTSILQRCVFVELTLSVEAGGVHGPVPGRVLQLDIVTVLLLTGKVTSVWGSEASEGVAHDVEAGGQGGQPEQTSNKILRTSHI